MSMDATPRFSPPLDAEAFTAAYTQRFVKLLDALPGVDIVTMLRALETAHAENRQVFLVGNGGSAATASHWANDLTWGLARAGIRPLRAIALTDNVPVMTAIANDASYEEIFSRQLDALGRPGDLLIAISGSGNSPNVVRAVELAKRMGLRSVGLLGMGGGRVAKLVDIAVTVPSSDYGPIEDVHMMLDHLAMAYLRDALKA